MSLTLTSLRQHTAAVMPPKKVKVREEKEEIKLGPDVRQSTDLFHRPVCVQSQFF